MPPEAAEGSISIVWVVLALAVTVNEESIPVLDPCNNMI